MNHGPAFQALWAKLRAEVRELQSKGYYGDGQYPDPLLDTRIHFA